VWKAAASVTQSGALCPAIMSSCLNLTDGRVKQRGGKTLVDFQTEISCIYRFGIYRYSQESRWEAQKWQELG
jgi:hypothetical protein